MRKVSEIRRALGRIPEALLHFDPARDQSGDAPGTRVIRVWGHPDESDQGTWLTESPELTYQESGYHSLEWPDFEEVDLDPVFEIGPSAEESQPILGKHQLDEIRQSVLVHGTDALGHYLSFHVLGAQWGVYIRLSGIAYLIQDVLAKIPVSHELKAQLAFHAILNHELFHFATDYGIAQMEMLFAEPWWVPTRAHLRNANPGYLLVEEKLANAYMLRAFQAAKAPLRIRGKQEVLREFTMRQPEGYREGVLVRRRGTWDGILIELARAYGQHTRTASAQSLLWRSELGFDWPAQFPLWPKTNWRYCAIHLVDDSRRFGIPAGWLNLFVKLANVEESPEFKAKLGRYGRNIARAWERTKQKLCTHITRGCDFKQWGAGPDGIFSTRVDANFRAHLLRQQDPERWLAFDIGPHKAMGHG